jgi:CO/xanthine dehydrogenase Mo-binding subunit
VATKLIGQDYTTPDLVAKVTGRAKYAEDFRADGMLFAKLLLSPMPHARVRGIDLRAALALDGVMGLLTPDDLPPLTVDPGAARPELALAREPLYQGEPILAVAAVDETTAALAIERITVDLEPLPFVIDPLESLRPGGPNARLEGNVYVGARIEELKWSEDAFAELDHGRLPMGRAPDEWSYGDLDAGFREAALVLDESFYIPSTSHQPLETRTAMAYWQNGVLYMHCSTQSTARTAERVAAWVGVEPSRVVVISEFTGGGFGSKGTGAVSSAIPALLARKTNRPVMMRISREEEHAIGRARAGWQGRAKMGFRRDGRVTALDFFLVQDNGSYARQGDHQTGGRIASLAYQPLAMRFRGVTVLTNTPPRNQQRSPGGMQANGALEPIVSKAARALGIDQVAIRRINAPEGKAPIGPPDKDARRPYVTSAFVKEALDRGASIFGWDERKARSGERRGSAVRGVGVAVSPFNAGSIGFDGLLTIRPDGRLYVQSGIGNLGTHSVIDVARVAAEALDMPWEKVDVIWGNTSKHLPWTCISVGSQSTHAMSRANHAAALDAKRKLQEIAAAELGGAPGDYTIGGERVFRIGDSSRGLTYAQAARRAIEMAGKYDGHELPPDVHEMTRTSATALTGLGLMGVAKDTFPRDGNTLSYVVGFAEVEVDFETGAYSILDYAAVVDVGTVVNPRSLKGQAFGGSMLGIGHAIGQKWVFDGHYGVPLATRFHHNKPPTILDAPQTYHYAALDIPDPETPVGARGIGEPPVGAGYGAVLNALADALSGAAGVDYIRRTPVTLDLILTTLESQGWLETPAVLRAHV